MISSVSASSNIQKRIRRYLYVLLAVLLLGSVIVGLVLWLAFGKTSERRAVQQELDALVKSEQDTQELRGVLSTEQESVSKINDFFPNESEVFSVFAQIEKLILAIDDRGVLSFADLQPRKVGAQNTLTLNVRMLASREQLMTFLRTLERMPYIIEIVSIDTQQFEDNLLLVILEVRLYVAEPFS